MAKLSLYYSCKEKPTCSSKVEIKKLDNFDDFLDKLKTVATQKLLYLIYEADSENIICIDNSIEGSEKRWTTTSEDILNTRFPVFTNFHNSKNTTNYGAEIELLDKFRFEMNQFLPLQTKENAKDFVKFLINTLGINFHPEDEFKNYLEKDNTLQISESEKIFFGIIDIMFMEKLISVAYELLGTELYEYGLTLIKNKVSEMKLEVISKPSGDELIQKLSEVLKRSNWLYDKKDADILEQGIAAGYILSPSATQAEFTQKAVNDFPHLFLFENKLKLFNLSEGNLIVNVDEMKTIFKKIGEKIISTYQMYDTQVEVEFEILSRGIRPEQHQEKILLIGKNLFPKEFVENVTFDGNVLKIEFDVEKIKNINTLTENSFRKVLSNQKSEGDTKFKYMMLSRLQQDCEYFLNFGMRSENVLPSKNIDTHIAYMKQLWNELTVKPEWLSMEKILEYEKEMKGETSIEVKKYNSLKDVIADIGARGVAKEFQVRELMKNNDFSDDFEADILGYYGLEAEENKIEMFNNLLSSYLAIIKYYYNTEIENFEEKFSVKYPFNASFDELDIDVWCKSIIGDVRTEVSIDNIWEALDLFENSIGLIVENWEEEYDEAYPFNISLDDLHLDIINWIQNLKEHTK